MDVETKRDLAAAREHYQAGEYAEAEAPLRRVLAKHDSFADLHNMLGVIEYQRGEPEAAATAFEKALAVNPRYNEAAMNYAVALNELGRYDEARTIYARLGADKDADPQETDELDPYVRGKISNLHAKVAEAYLSVGVYGPAINELRAALDLSPGFADLRVRLAVALRDVGLRDEALQELIAVREDKPDYVDARTQLGLTYWGLGDFASAHAEWQKALALAGDNPALRAYLSMAAGKLQS